MNVVPFIAESAADAVAQIRDQLGPEAVVLNVRQLPGQGLSRLWQSPRLEVLAYVPEAPAPEPDPLLDLRRQIAELRHQLTTTTTTPPPGPPTEPRAITPETRPPLPGGWHVPAMLESLGVLPIYAQRVLESLRARHGDPAPAQLSEELALLRLALGQMWRKLPSSEPTAGKELHLFLGAPGVGKTTCLCKWLAHATLLEGRTAEVLRLDGPTANTAESLSIYGDILGVPVHRFHDPDLSLTDAELVFVDVPGVPSAEAGALQALLGSLDQIAHPQVHLVLNAAYEAPALLSQVRAFSTLPVQDLVVTHLDEEARWGKLWNLVLGTNYPLRFLSAGQNVPGDFRPASADLLLGRLRP